MVEAESLIGHLRTQVRGLQALLNDLKSHHVVGIWKTPGVAWQQEEDEQR